MFKSPITWVFDLAQAYQYLTVFLFHHRHLYLLLKWCYIILLAIATAITYKYNAGTVSNIHSIPSQKLITVVLCHTVSVYIHTMNVYACVTRTCSCFILVIFMQTENTFWLFFLFQQNIVITLKKISFFLLIRRKLAYHHLWCECIRALSRAKSIFLTYSGKV